MMFVADDLAAWLTGLLADAGRKKLTTLVLSTDQERALRSAATAAVLLTAEELRPGDDEQAKQVVAVVSDVFTGAPLAGQETVLETLQAGIASQLAVLDDPGLTGTGKSSAQVLGVPATMLAQKLTGHLVREILARGAHGGSLAPLAAQLNSDVTHLLGQRSEGEVDQLDDKVRAVLARLDDTHAVATVPIALAQLPPKVAGFTGRDAELAVLSSLLDPAGTAGPAVVSAVVGPAGAGKTTLAVEGGHFARERGWFGGGVLFIDLHGYDKAPVEPGLALDALLRALGVPGEHIPPGIDERAELYRSVLAQVSDPVLVIADNASSETQVRPLLPGTGPHKVVVTSRHTLASLGARLVDVTVLDDAAAVALLDKALRAARSDDDRITSDRESATQLAGVCHDLPLALQIVAALLKADPRLSAAELAADLAVESARLGRLAYDDGSDAVGLSVAAEFELSYRRLEEVPARMFRLLPVNPGPDLSTAAAAVLADLPVCEVREVLARLARAHLTEAAPGRADRWRMHDLLRLHARRLSDAHAEADGREQARDRLLGYYLRMSDAADGHLRVLPGIVAPGEFTGRDDALAWLDEERANLVATVEMAMDTGRDWAALDLPIVLAGYFDCRRRFDDWLATMTISLKAATNLGDAVGQGIALMNLGPVLREVRRFEEAITASQTAAAIFRKTGDRQSEGMVSTNLGSALQEMRRFEEAITASQAAAAIFRKTGDRIREGIALNNLGLALLEVRRFEEAITASQAAVAIFRKTGDRHREAIALGNLETARAAQSA